MTTPAEAAVHLRARLAFETDASDTYAALSSGAPGFVLVDTRSLESWNLGHARGAVHVPLTDLATHVPAEFGADSAFVVYCWGPGCNGATNAGLVLSELGYSVREMIGGFEYWAREGLPVDKVVTDAAGASLTIDDTRVVDPLTSPRPTRAQRLACDC